MRKTGYRNSHGYSFQNGHRFTRDPFATTDAVAGMAAPAMSSQKNIPVLIRRSTLLLKQDGRTLSTDEDLPIMQIVRTVIFIPHDIRHMGSI